MLFDKIVAGLPCILRGLLNRISVRVVTYPVALISVAFRQCREHPRYRNLPLTMAWGPPSRPAQNHAPCVSDT